MRSITAALTRGVDTAMLAAANAISEQAMKAGAQLVVSPVLL